MVFDEPYAGGVTILGKTVSHGHLVDALPHRRIQIGVDHIALLIENE